MVLSARCSWLQHSGHCPRQPVVQVEPGWGVGRREKAGSLGPGAAQRQGEALHLEPQASPAGPWPSPQSDLLEPSTLDSCSLLLACHQFAFGLCFYRRNQESLAGSMVWQRRPRVAAASSEVTWVQAAVASPSPRPKSWHIGTGRDPWTSLSWLPVLHVGTPGPREGQGGQGNTGARAWGSKPTSFPTHNLPDLSPAPLLPAAPGNCMGYLSL